MDKVLVFKDIKNNRWTLWDENKKKHLGYRKSLNLSNCIFIVKKNERKIILKTKKRFPHAWVIGNIKKPSKRNKKSEISYNPFLNKNFVKNRNKDIFFAKELFFDSKGKVWC